MVILAGTHWQQMNGKGEARTAAREEGTTAPQAGLEDPAGRRGDHRHNCGSPVTG